MVYQCNEKFKGERKCETPHVTEEQVKSGFVAAFNKLMDNRDLVINACRRAQKALCDTAGLDAELDDLRKEIEIVTELSRRAIYENARIAQDQADFDERYNEYAERHRNAAQRISELEAVRQERLNKSKILGVFIRDIERDGKILCEFDEGLWLAVIDHVTVGIDGAMMFKFKDGTDITEKRQ